MSGLLALVRAHREATASNAASGRFDDEEARRLESSLIDFVEAAWPSIDASKYLSNWAVDGLCEHLQAVTEGQIRRLLVNFPPRCQKTISTSVCWPAWTWARRQVSYLSGPQVRFLCGSYGHTLALLNSNLTRRLILSPWYQSLWGDRFVFRADQNTKVQFDLDTGGSRLAASVGGSLLGLGGDIVIVDDPHSTADIESEAERESVLTWWKEISTTRLNDPKQAAIVVIMQRLHQSDVSGTILDSDNEDWIHYCVPMEYESRRHCVTVLGWQDPRGLDEDGDPLVLIGEDGERFPRDSRAETILEDEREGQLMWPERFGPKEVAALKSGLGVYLASGRLQQSPAPRSGGIFKREHWELWDHHARGPMFPPTSYRVASLDGAFSEREENDPSALSVWGVFKHPDLGVSRIMLMGAWRKHLAMHGDPTPRNEFEKIQPGDTEEVVRRRNLQYKRRVGEIWGLVEWTRETCKRFNVDVLLIENKASGKTVAQELQRIYGYEGRSVHLVEPKGDKVARALAVQPMFAQGLIYAPNLDWADLVINEAAVFPRGKTDDLVDSMTQALLHLRTTGVARTDAEQKIEELGLVTHRRRPSQPLYPV